MNRRGFLGRLTAFLAGLAFWRRAEAVENHDFAPWSEGSPSDWVEDELTPTTDTLRREASELYVLLEPANPQYFRAGDIIHFPRTGENCRVIEVDHVHGFIRVQRGLGSKARFLNEDEPVWILGGASETSYEDEAQQQAAYEQYKRETDAGVVIHYPLDDRRDPRS